MASPKELRKHIFLAAYSGGVGHLASAFSAVEILSALYLGGVMKYKSSQPEWEGRDYFILSKGHGSLALYAVLCDAGFFPKAEMYRFCQPSGVLGGEPHTLDTPGVEASTGSLGHGLSIGVGIALALKLDSKSNRVYALIGDGECQEGSIWEAVMSGAAFKLNNFTAIVDNNKIQKMDYVKNIVGDYSIANVFEAFGWQVKTVDGHNIDELKYALNGEWDEDKPRCVVAETVKGKGVSLMENNPAWHWRMPSRKELKVFISELDITEEELERCKKRT
ncbi:MAG: transketolase [Oscillospiraceae bacterium]|jgi:transketolase|nr:transketolase [Oscillospiraceae bacterium]